MKATKIFNSYVLVKPEKRPDQVGHIILPEGELKAEKVTEGAGTVMQLAAEFRPKNRPKAKPLLEPPVKVGDRIMYRGFLKDLYQLPGTELFFLHYEDILAVVGEEVKVGTYYLST